MCRCLICNSVGLNTSLYQFGQDLRCVAQDTDRNRFFLPHCLIDDRQRIIELIGPCIEIPRPQSHIDSVGLTFDSQHRCARHRCSQRLSPPHASEPGGQDPLAGEIAAIMLPAHLDEGLVCSLHDSLTADINPRTGCHLTEHHETLLVEFAKVIPVGPCRNEIGVRDQHPRCVFMCLEHADRFSGLHQQRLVIFELDQGFDDRIKAFPVSRSLANATIHDKLFRTLGNVRIEVVHEHS